MSTHSQHVGHPSAPSPQAVAQPGTSPNCAAMVKGDPVKAKPTATTVDVVDHSRHTDALERALDRAACCRHWRNETRDNSDDEWVERALEQLESEALRVTVTDYRLIGWGKHDPIPRGWGCYRINHLTSGQWLEMIASRSLPSSTPRAIAVRGNMVTLLQVLLAVPERSSGDDDADDIDIDIDLDALLDEPTEPGWPPGEQPSEDHWWNDTGPAVG